MHCLGLVLAGAALVLAGCGKPAPPEGTAGHRAGDVAGPLAAPPASPPPAPVNRRHEGTVTMRYDCEQGHRVAIVGGDMARVTLADGRAIEIARVDGSAPPRYSGEALSFEVGSRGAMLGQDESGGFACREA